MAKLHKPQEWEKNHINRLTLQALFAAAIGTTVAALLAYILKSVGFGEIKPELLFMPWGIVLVLGVSIAFRKGVAAERERTKDDPKP